MNCENKNVVFETRICPKSLKPENKTDTHVAYQVVGEDSWNVCLMKDGKPNIFESNDHNPDNKTQWNNDVANIFRDYCFYKYGDDGSCRRIQERIVRINGVMFDFDCHSADDMPLEEIGKILLSDEFAKEVPYKMVVMSGNGFQLHMLCGISMDDSNRSVKLKQYRDFIEAMMKYFIARWKLKPDEACKDPNRNHRVVGSWNTKAMQNINDLDSRKKVVVVKEKQVAGDDVRMFYLKVMADYPAPERPKPAKIDIPADGSEVEKALYCIDPSKLEYHQWLSIGMALHSWDEVKGLMLWDKWSAQDAERYDSREIDYKWSGFRDRGVTVGTLFHIAKDYGYVPVKPQSLWSEINYYEVEIVDDAGNIKTVKKARPWQDVIDRLLKLSDGRVINCQDYLYAKPAMSGGEMLDVADASKYFGWLGSQCSDDTMGWSQKVSEAINEAKAFHLVLHSVDKYRSIESAPHYPLMPECYYNYPELPKPDYDALDAFIGRFNPKTKEDKALILAMVMTVVWGGAYGSRPAFVITSEDGKGVGKSTLAYKTAQLIKQVAIDGNTKADMETFRTRLLSVEGMKKRIVVFDNETGRVDSDAMAQMITAKSISGKRMYVGEGERPNNLIWIITLNSTHLSGDLSARAVPIHLSRPEFYHSSKQQGLWEQETNKIIEEKRYGIISALIDLLKKERPVPEINIRFTQWGAEVLTKACDYYGIDYKVIEKSIIAMQNENDSDADEVLLIEDRLKQLVMAEHTLDADELYFIPNDLATELYRQATGKNCNKITALRELKGLIRLGKLKLKDHRTASERGFLYGNLSNSRHIKFRHDGKIDTLSLVWKADDVKIVHDGNDANDAVSAKVENADDDWLKI